MSTFSAPALDPQWETGSPIHRVAYLAPALIHSFGGALRPGAGGARVYRFSHEFGTDVGDAPLVEIETESHGWLGLGSRR